jgi:hypothetical protein
MVSAAKLEISGGRWQSRDCGSQKTLVTAYAQVVPFAVNASGAASGSEEFLVSMW